MRQLESLAAPWPGKIESDAEPGVRRRQARQLHDRRRLASGNAVPQPTDLLEYAAKLAHPIDEHRLVGRQGLLQPFGVALQYPRYLSEAEAERSQGRNFGGAVHLARTIGPPSGSGADRHYQAMPFVKPQGFDRHTEPAGGFGSGQELG
jgi:hypothetical protein